MFGNILHNNSNNSIFSAILFALISVILYSGIAPTNNTTIASAASKLSAAKQILNTSSSPCSKIISRAYHRNTTAAMTTTAAAPVPRTISKAFLAIEQSEGQGAKVRRSIGTPSLRNFSPFLMLDHFSVAPPAGFPDHPHRGQETITYLLQGAVDHEDFTGARGTINSGDLQFMTAGKGIQHAPLAPRFPLHGLHNGSVYTYPKCIEGVPLAKIHPGHPYWDPKWPDLRSLVEPVLRSWEEKHNHAIELQRQGKKVGSVKYQYGRQVNRGKTILEFLMHGVISPYQLLSKRFMSVGKGSITSYDTLFRLCDTVNELAKYKLDVEPVEWLRQRLHELVETQGEGFNFPKTIHDFYNDPKLAALRFKSGFKSIGRPSGIKMPRRDGTADDSPRPKRRKKKKREWEDLSESYPVHGHSSENSDKASAVDSQLKN
ncbi:hypothetical protein NQ176_g1282 [Zarea fungicola]|uniref:Uncharacterized protein n=1 Tax=Zarea fungicola TaxID=93591 RepID=A0ACC1NTF7_9HYPO|nr:hypothetical protein NQ176_g1282 [Lecanicillium fungicola]